MTVTPGSEASPAAPTRLEGPAPAMEIARHIAGRAARIAPVLLALGAFWGVAGVASVAYALAIVVVNFLLAGWMLQVTGRISFAAMAGAAMFGYLIRLGIITLAVFPVLGASWVREVPLGAALIVTHLGLLMWELRHLSLSYAYPGLKPSVRRLGPLSVRPADASADAA